MKLKHKLYSLGIIVSTLSITNLAIGESLKYAPYPKIKKQQSQFKTTPSNYRELLFKLLLAETAKQRNLSSIAMDNYLQVAEESQDAELAQIATGYAIDIKAPKQALEAVELWTELAPSSLDPQIIAVTLLINIDPEQAQGYLSRAIAIDPYKLNQHLVNLYKKLSLFSQKNLKLALNNLKKDEPKNPYPYLYTAQIAAIENQPEEANKLTDKALALNPNLTHAIELKAKLIRYQHKTEKSALQYLEQKTKDLPKDNELLLFYSSALIDAAQFEQAIPLLTKISQSKEYKFIAKLGLSEALYAQKKYSQAKEVLLEIVQQPVYKSNAAYYLGQIAEHQNNLKEAIRWYSVVEHGEFHIAAVLKACLLLIVENSHQQALRLIRNASPATFLEQKSLILTEMDILSALGEHEQALRLINKALLIIPTDVDFLYARSTVASSLRLYADIERDLRAILNLVPNHASALNALGYTLANQGKDMSEAMEYIKRAINIEPNNPAYIDSMGWLLYQMGKTEESIAMLQNAHQLDSTDVEIAAHLGEVLWTTGNKKKAKSIWKKSLKLTPNNPVLLQTLQKFKVDF